MSGERYADCSVLGVLAADLANPGVGEYDVTPHNKPKIPSVHIDAKHQISRKSGSITIGDKVMLIGSAGDAGGMTMTTRLRIPRMMTCSGTKAVRYHSQREGLTL